MKNLVAAFFPYRFSYAELVSRVNQPQSAVWAISEVRAQDENRLVFHAKLWVWCQMHLSRWQIQFSLPMLSWQLHLFVGVFIVATIVVLVFLLLLLQQNCYRCFCPAVPFIHISREIEREKGVEKRYFVSRDFIVVAFQTRNEPKMNEMEGDN